MVKRGPKPPPDTVRLDRIEERLGRLIGEGPAGFFQSARAMIDSGALPATASLVWHCAREIESSIFLALGPIAPLDPAANPKEMRKAHVEAIATHLALPAADPAIAWWRQNSLHTVAHRNNLGPARALADADWRTYTEALAVILDAFESRYNALLGRLDEILAKGPAKAGAEAKVVLCAIPPTGRAAALGHFLSGAGPEWLHVLPKCLLHDVPGPAPAPGQPGYVTYSRWPVSEYLARVAPVEPRPVAVKVARIMRMDVRNPWVHRDLLQAAAHFAMPEARRWAADEARWLSAQQALVLPDDVAGAVERLAQQGLVDEAFSVGGALLSLVPGASGSRFGEAGLRMQDYEYEECLRRVAATLRAVDPMRTFDWLDDLTAEAVAQSYPSDATYGSRIWLNSVEELAADPNPTALGVMAEELRKAAVDAAVDAATLGRVVDALLARAPQASTPTRVAVDVLRERRAVDPAAVVRHLADPLFYTFDRWPEVLRLVEQVVPSIDPAVIPAIRSAVEHSALHEDSRGPILAHLDAAETGTAAPAPIDFESPYAVGTHLPSSPVPVTALAGWSVRRVVGHVTGYKPDPSVWRDGETLASDLSGVAKARPGLYSSAGPGLLPLGSRWAPYVFHGLQQALSAGTSEIRWSALARFLETAFAPGGPWAGAEFSEAKKAALWLLDQGLAGGSLPLAADARRAIWRALDALAGDPDPDSAAEARSGAASGGTTGLAINGVRPLAVAVAARLATATAARSRLGAEARRLLEASLAGTGRTPSVCFALAERAPSLFRADPEWTRSILPALLPDDPALAGCRGAAWQGLLNAHAIGLAMVPDLLPYYGAAVDSMDRSRSTAEDRAVAQHVARLVLLGLVGASAQDDLGRRLLRNASPEVLEGALESVGHAYYGGRADPPDADEASRAVMLWTAAAGEVASGNAPASTLSPFGWWYASGFTDNDWLDAELERLESSDVVVEPMHLVWARLASRVPSDLEAVARLADLVVARSVTDDRLRLEDVRTVAKALLAAPSGTAPNEAGARIVNRMRSKGFSRFPDL